MKRNIKYLIALISCLFAIIIIEYFAPRPIDWTATLSKNDKIPYGSFAVFDLLKQVANEQEISVNKQTIYLSFDEIYDEKTSFVCITNRFVPDELEINSLLDYVHEGNTAFISASLFDEKFLDTLNLSVKVMLLQSDDSTTSNFTNPRLYNKDGYKTTKLNSNVSFSTFDTLSTVVLGRFETSDTIPIIVFGESANKHADLIKLDYGEGSFLISTQPYFFTNYAILYGGLFDYVVKVFSYLPKYPILWDEHYKPFAKDDLSPLNYILSQSPLRAAYYVFIAGMFIFVFFEMKRRQRIIPIIKPLNNTSLEFISTIARLYLHRKNHRDILIKRFNYFREFLRTKYNINQTDSELPDFERISEKTGVNITLVKRVFYNFNKLIGQKKINNDELLLINNLIDRFYNSCK